jgi:hypothetical protein
MPRGCLRPDLKATRFDECRDLNEIDPPTGNLRIFVLPADNDSIFKLLLNARRIYGQTTPARERSGPITFKEYEDHWKT